MDASFDPPVPSANVCMPPLAIVPDASSPGDGPPVEESDHAIPSPQTAWPSVTMPPMRTLPVTGLFHVTATPALGDGCMLTLFAGNVRVGGSESGSALLLMTMIGASALAVLRQP